MKVTLTYYGQLRQIAGVESQSSEYPHPIGLGDLIADLGKRYGPDFGKILFDESNRLRPSVIILLNDALVAREPLPLLKDGDKVVLLPAIAGG